MSKTKKKLILASIGICLLGGAVLAVESHDHDMWDIWSLKRTISNLESKISELESRVNYLEWRIY